MDGLSLYSEGWRIAKIMLTKLDAQGISTAHGCEIVRNCRNKVGDKWQRANTVLVEILITSLTRFRAYEF